MRDRSMPAFNEVATSTSAAVLEPSGVHPRQLEQAMKQVAAALSKEQSGSSRVYGVVVYGIRSREPKPNYLAATGTFFKAYFRGLKALSYITSVILTHPKQDHLQTLEAGEFG